MAVRVPPGVPDPETTGRAVTNVPAVTAWVLADSRDVVTRPELDPVTRTESCLPWSSAPTVRRRFVADATAVPSADHW